MTADYVSAMEYLQQQAVAAAQIPPPVLGPTPRPRTFADVLREVGISNEMRLPGYAPAEHLRWWQRMFL